MTISQNLRLAIKPIINFILNLFSMYISRRLNLQFHQIFIKCPASCIQRNVQLQVYREKQICLNYFASHQCPCNQLLLQGAVPRGTATKENIAKLGLKDGQVVYKCPKCVSIKPERAHHCR